MMCAICAEIASEGHHEREAKIFAQEVRRFGGVRFGIFRVARRAEALERIRGRYRHARSRAKFRPAPAHSGVARPRNPEPAEVALRERPPRSVAGGEGEGYLKM